MGCFNGAARFCVRKSIGPSGPPPWTQSFNGAARFCVRKLGSLGGEFRQVYGFNGAARFCVRKCVRRHVRNNTAQQASMGPHVFACGNYLRGVQSGARARASMGPHVFACGNDIRLHLTANDDGLQWGRTFLRAEIMRARPEAAPVVELQWGRTFLRAEITPRHKARSKGASFNGAARFCVRKFAR